MTGLRFLSARQVFETYPDLGGDMVAGPSDLAPLHYVSELERSTTPEDAITFCAHVLDRRKAVWWGLECVRALGAAADREEDTALRVTEAWVREPEEHRRLAALAIGLSANRDRPGTWMALAAGGSGGTLRTGDLPGPPVPPQLCASATRTAVLIALSAHPPRDRAALLTKCIQLFRNLADRV